VHELLRRREYRSWVKSAVLTTGRPHPVYPTTDIPANGSFAPEAAIRRLDVMEEVGQYPTFGSQSANRYFMRQIAVRSS
jgi:hypothetical protein